MESSAFPNKIEMMKLEMYKFMNISIPLKIKQKHSKLETMELSGKHPFPLLLLFRGKCINWKKLNVRTLPFSGTNWAHQVLTLLILLSGH